MANNPNINVPLGYIPHVELDCCESSVSDYRQLIRDHNLYENKGDIVTSDGDKTTVLNVGPDESLLTADSSTLGGLKWTSSTDTCVGGLCDNDKDTTVTTTGNRILVNANNGFSVQPFTPDCASGCAIPAQGPGRRMMYHAGEIGFRAGRVSGTQWDQVNFGTGSVAFGQDNTASGVYSFAHGLNSEASGAGATAWGTNALAPGISSLAYGTNVIASGRNSLAFGNTCSSTADESFTAGISCNATADGAVAIGCSNTASGSYSVAQNAYCTSSGIYSHAEGFSSTASGNNSHAEGTGTISSGKYSHVEGKSSMADGWCAHAEGGETTSSGYYSHSEGYQTTTTGNQGHAEGRETIAGGDHSHAEGYKCVTTEREGHAEGSTTTASGEQSHAEGHTTTASGERSHAEGYQTIASGPTSHAQGRDTTASGYRSHAEGRETIASGPNSHAEGRETITIGDDSHAEGLRTIATGDQSHAEGYDSQTRWDSTHAEGQKTYAYGYQSHAEGFQSRAYGNKSHAQGYSCASYGEASSANGRRSDALGSITHVNGLFLRIGDPSWTLPIAHFDPPNAYDQAIMQGSVLFGRNCWMTGSEGIRVPLLKEPCKTSTITDFTASAPIYNAPLERWISLPNGNLNSTGVLDSVVVTNDRILVKNETGPSSLYNGVWIVVNLGSASSPWELQRAHDWNAASSPIQALTSVMVLNGSANGGKLFRIGGAVIVDVTNFGFSVSILNLLSSQLATVADLNTGTPPTYSAGELKAAVNETINNTSIVDSGYTLVVGDRLLVKDDSNGDATLNGIYDVVDLGSGSAPWILQRSFDFESGDSIQAWSSTLVVNGDVHGGDQLRVTANVTVDMDTIAWSILFLRAQTIPREKFSLYLGNGTSQYDKNGVRIALQTNTVSGIGYADAWLSGGADYAEYFEWDDENVNEDERVGYFVELVNGDRIQLTTTGDSSSVLGVVSGNPGVIGNAEQLRWQGMWLKDSFGQIQVQTSFIDEIYQLLCTNNNAENISAISKTSLREIGDLYNDGILAGSVDDNVQLIQFIVDDIVDQFVMNVPVLSDEDQLEIDKIIENIKNVQPTQVPIMNPDYDPNAGYTSREKRIEWSTIGLMGRLRVRDDGTCVVGGKCDCVAGGTATAGTQWYVLKRIDGSENVVEILFK